MWLRNTTTKPKKDFKARIKQMSFAVNFSPLPLRSPELTTGSNSSPKPFTSLTRRRPPMLSFAKSNSTQEPPTTIPEIELEFIGPKAEADGKYAVDRAVAVSGEKLLRSIMSDNKLELYGMYGKLMNCGGGGSCGTCIVEVVEGKELLNERTNTEFKYLKKKPESWRLACQTIVGNKENSGKVVIQRLPQQKK